jgi:hypothetical protein
MGEVQNKLKPKSLDMSGGLGKEELPIVERLRKSRMNWEQTNRDNVIRGIPLPVKGSPPSKWSH